MSTGAIVAIVVVALIILALLAFVLPRMRRTAEVRARERELEQRRDRVATEHQQVATERDREAEAADQRARLAQAEAERQRAEAQVHERQAEMHKQGLADDELIDDSERERFAPAVEKRNAQEADERTSGGSVTSSDREGGRAHEPEPSTGARSSYEQGRVDERDAERGQ
jgi:FtsZ-interacting cell division protein ZipA